MNIIDGFRGLHQVLGNGLNIAAQKSHKAVGAAAEGKDGSRLDEAHVSSAATLATRAAAAPDVRMEKVTAIQQALAAGTYQVSNSDVAASLINHLLQR